MVPIRLSLTNFLSYGEDVPPLDFTEFRVACISGANGHGKSALLDAMTWALWGEARRGSSDRKPDDGLLRIGASEMRVEFDFDLEGARYRVLRSYRRSVRGGVSALELQAYDHERGAYVTLSEAGSSVRTQARIESLLRMSYDTFVTSALVLQGRANEFTTRPARERKAVLAEILGLSRYDELARRARLRAQDAGREADRQDARLAEIDAQVAGRAEAERELERIADSLSGAEVRIGEGERDLSDAMARRAELQARRREGEEAKATLSRVEAEAREARGEIEALRLQIAEDEALLARRKEIEGEAEAHLRLRAQETALQSKIRALRELEAERSRLETRILEARHEVERRKEAWRARLKASEEAAAEAREVTSRQSEIEDGHRELEEARREERVWEDRREQFEALEAQRLETERQIEEARARLEMELEQVRAQESGLAEKAAAGDRARAEWVAAAEELGRLTVLERERESLRERGTSLGAEIEVDRRQVESRERELKQSVARLDLLRRSRDAQCPLCESALDEGHRAGLVARLAAEVDEKNREIASLRSKIRMGEEERSDLRAHYQRLKDQARDLSEVRGSIAKLEHAVRIGEEARLEADALRARGSALETQIRNGVFAQEARLRLADIARGVRGIGYGRERHLEVKETIRRCAPFEAQKARLDAAIEALRKALDALPEIREKLETADLYLKERRYAQREHAELRDLLARIDVLGYDPEKHRRIAEEVSRTADAVTRRDLMEAASARLARTREDLARAERRLTGREREVGALKERCEASERVIREAGDVEGRVATAEASLRAAREERDALLGRRGGLTARLDHWAALSSEREGVENAARDARKDREVYEALAEAFGKDGIQALIIESAVPEIESEANGILSRLTDNRTQVAIESLRDLKKGGTRETLDIKISDELGERSYELYSGGEAFRIDFALRIALAKLLARRAGTRLRTLILDEGFGTQDAEGLEHLIEAIQAIGEDFDKVLVITHVDEIKNAFAVHIQVTKYPDIGSRFEIVH